jgi:hypothetical protein
MKKRLGSGRGLILFELIIVLGFFAVFAAVFLRIFLAAGRLSAEDEVRSRAAAAAQNAAECFKAGVEPTLYYDEKWEPAEKNVAVYILTLDFSQFGGVGSAEITVRGTAGEALFSLTAKRLEEVGT